MNDPYSPPNAPIISSPHSQRRPWPVYPIALICIAPALILLTAFALEPSLLYSSLRYGAIQSLVFISGLVFALGLALAGIQLFFLRKYSIWLLSLCILWPVLRAAIDPKTIYFAASFILGISIVLSYCIYLKRRGLLC